MIYVKLIGNKVYIENEIQCLAIMSRYSIEVFGNTDNEFENKFYFCIKNGSPNIKDWNLFKEKVKEVYNFELNDKFIPESFNIKGK